MMVNVYYLSTLASRDETWDASHGKLMPAKLYSLASVINWLPPCFAPDDWRTSLCETIYNRLQAVDAPIKNHNGYTIRSIKPWVWLLGLHMVNWLACSLSLSMGMKAVLSCASTDLSCLVKLHD